MDSYFGELGDGAGSIAGNEDLSMLGYWNQLWDRCKSGDIVSSVYETADAMLRVKRKFNDAEKWRAFAQGDQFAGLRLALREDPFIYRSESQVADIAKKAVGAESADVRTFTDVLGNVAFAEIRRKAA